MTGLSVLYPQSADATPAFILNRSRARLRPFSDAAVALLDMLSRDLFALSRTDPALAPLAFFIRRSNILALASDARARFATGTVASPQGLVLHIPPTNVDTLFLYTLAIALLTGNSNIVRISRNAGPSTYRIVDLLVRRLEDHPEVAAMVTIVQFDRDKALLDRLSETADVRMIWGGDAAVRGVRESPLSTFGKDLAFPDRVSIGAVSVPAWIAADSATRTGLVDGLYNDTFWFDQMACSSPVQLLLVGGSQQDGDAAADGIARELADLASRRYEDVDGQAVNKMIDVLRGLDRGLRDVSWISNSVVTLSGADLGDAIALRPGGGFFTTQHLASLAELAHQVTRRIQTLSVFGFTTKELTELAELVNGAGIDRIVPIGQALDFSSVWDGKDLVMELLRLTVVTGDA